ncbi:hypothetical protein LCGC14_2927140 [marine sediment metagenome]|uniref:Uncharacterized protein n=1 Tax=marine sediment metagenome TaxID=412755 RepID=A0A0F8XM27_9ZZZZ
MWISALIVGFIVIAGMAAKLVWPTIEANWFPPTPTPIPVAGSVIVREVPPLLDDMPLCNPQQSVSIADPVASPYLYSALKSLQNMSLAPGLEQRESLDGILVSWVWSKDDGLEYWVEMDGVQRFEFKIRCFVEVDGVPVVQFDTVEVRQID